MALLDIGRLVTRPMASAPPVARSGRVPCGQPVTEATRFRVNNAEVKTATVGQAAYRTPPSSDGNGRRSLGGIVSKRL